MTRFTSRALALVVAVLGVLFGSAAPAAAVAAPTITSFTPTSGPLRTSVKITGTNFVAPVSVTFNKVAATTVTVTSTSITALVPSGANTGPIRVTTSGGTATSTTNFTETPGVYLPTTAGPPGTRQTLTFSSFTPYEAVDVYFDSTDLRLVSAGTAGSGKTAVSVPAAASPGEHFFTAVGRKSGVSAQSSFTVRTDWPQFGSGASRPGENSTESILGAGNVRKLTRTWTSNTATNYNYGGNQAIVAGGILYAANGNGVTALSASTGALVWSRALGAVVTTPAVSGSTVVLGTNAGHLIGLDAATGATRHDVDYAVPVNLPFAVADGIAYAMGYDPDAGTTAILAFNPATGAVSWGGSLPSNCNPGSVSNKVLYTTCNNGHLYAVKTTGGGLLFDKDITFYRSVGTPVVVDGLVITGGSIVNTSSDVVIAVDESTGEYVWVQNTALDLIPGTTLSAADGQVVVRGRDVNGNDGVAAFAVASGSPLWSVRAPSGTAYATSIANGLLYVPGYGATTVYDLVGGYQVTQLRGGEFAIVTDAGVYTASATGTSVARYSLPASMLPAARRPAAATLRPNRTLRAAA